MNKKQNLEFTAARTILWQRVLMISVLAGNAAVLCVSAFLVYVLLQVLPVLKEIQRQQALFNEFIQQPVVIQVQPVKMPVGIDRPLYTRAGE